MDQQQRTILIALKKARTSIDKIITQLERAEAPGCFGVMQQTLAAIGLLRNANNHMLARHLEETLAPCAQKALRKKDIAALQAEIVKIVQAAARK